MTTKINDFDLVALSALTSSGTASSGDQVTLTKGATSTIVGTETAGEAIHGRSVKFTLSASETGYGYYSWTAPAALAVRGEFRMAANPGGALDIVQINRVGGVRACSARIGSDGSVVLKDYNGVTTLYTCPNTLSLPGVYTFDLSCQPGSNSPSNNGKIAFAVYDANGDLALGMTAVQEFTNVNAGDLSVALQTTNFGRITSSAWAYEYVLDSAKASDAYGLLGPWVDLSAPVTWGSHLSIG